MVTYNLFDYSNQYDQQLSNSKDYDDDLLILFIVIIKMKSASINYYNNNVLLWPRKYGYTALLCVFVVFTIFFTFDLFPLCTLYYNTFVLSAQTDRALRLVQSKIQNLKLNVNNPEQYKNCQSLFQYSINSSIESQQINQKLSSGIISKICPNGGDILQTSEEVVMITVLIGRKELTQNLRLEIKLVENRIRELGQFEFYLEIQQLQPALFPAHIREKIYSPTYREMIGQYLMSTRFIRNCQYTHKICQSSLILLQNNNEQNGYYEYQSIYFTSSGLYQQVLMSILDIDLFAETSNPRANWQQYQQLQYLHTLSKQLQYLSEQFIGRRNRVAEDRNKNVSNYLKHVLLYLQQTEKTYYLTKQVRRPEQILNNQQFNRIDIFPTQYKVGIMMPLSVTFVIFPFMNFMKA